MVHKHKCPDCGNIWSHERPPFTATAAEYHAAHNCPQCGTNVRKVYFTPEEEAEHQRKLAVARALFELLFGGEAEDADMDTDEASGTASPVDEVGPAPTYVR